VPGGLINYLHGRGRGLAKASKVENTKMNGHGKGVQKSVRVRHSHASYT